MRHRVGRRGNRTLGLSAAVAVALGGTLPHAAGDDITLNNGDIQNYTPAASIATTGVTQRTFTGAAQNDTSLLNLSGTATSFGTLPNIVIAAQPSTTATRFVGKLNIALAGNYTLFTSSDDGSRLFIDGILAVNNEGSHGVVELSKVVNLDTGLHDLRVDFVNNGGAGGITVSYQGPDQATKAAIPQTALFVAENNASVSTTVLPNNVTVIGGATQPDNVTLAAGAAATVNLNGTSYAAAGLGSLTFNAGSQLNATGSIAGDTRRQLRFNTTALAAGTQTFNASLDVAPGTITGGTAATAIVKTGQGRLILENASATANALVATPISVQAGSLYVIGSSAGTGATNPLGTSVVTLAGGTLSLDTAVGDVTFGNAFAMTASSTIQAVPGPRTMTLSNTTPITVAGGQTLTLNTYTGSNNAGGAILSLAAPLTGTGTLSRTQTNAGTGGGQGVVILSGDSSAFSGPVNVPTGVLEGRAATAAAKPFGTGTIALAGGQLNLRGGNAAATTYTFNNPVTVTANTTIDANSFAGAAGSTVQLGALSIGGQTLVVSGGNGYAVSFASAAMTGNTTINNGINVTVAGNVTQDATARTLTKTGAGTLFLPGANTYAGGTVINGGTVSTPLIADSVASGIGTSGNVTLGGGTLQYTGAAAATTARTFTGTAASTSGLDVPASAGGLTLTGPLSGSATFTVNKTNTGQLTLGGAADNAFLQLNAQGGTAVLAKASTASVHGAVRVTGIASGATVQLAGTGGDQISDTAGAGVSNLVGTLDFNGRNEAFDLITGSGVVTNNAGVGSPSVMTVGVGNGSMVFGGSIKDGATGGTMALTKAGTGGLTLAATNHTYSGLTTVNGGTLQLATPLVAPTLANPSFEAPSLGGGDAFTYTGNFNAGQLTAFVWTPGGNGYVAASTGGPALVSNSTAWNYVRPYPNGVQAVSLQRDGSVTQTLNFAAPGVYTLTFNAAQRPNQTNPGVVKLDGTTVFNFSPATGATPAWTPFTTTITVASAGTHTLTFAGTITASDQSIAIDNIALAGSASAGQLPIDASLVLAGQSAAGGPFGTFDLNGQNQTIARLVGGGISGTGTSRGIVTNTGITDSILTVTGASSGTFGGAIVDGPTNKVGLTKSTFGILGLFGPNTYTGPTSISDSTVVVNGSLGNTSVTVSTGGTLGGSGTIAGPVSITSGGNLSPGDSPGILGTGSVTLTSGATMTIELNGAGVGTGYDQLNVTGAVDLGGSTLAASLGFTPVANSQFIIVQNDGLEAVNGTFAGLINGANLSIGGQPFTISYTGGTGNDVVLTAVPEPATLGSLALAAAAGLLGRRRRRG